MTKDLQTQHAPELETLMRGVIGSTLAVVLASSQIAALDPELQKILAALLLNLKEAASWSQLSFRRADGRLLDSVLRIADLGESQGDSDLVGVELKHSQIRDQFDLIILAVKRSSGDMLFNPGGDTVLCEHDTVIAVGHCSTSLTVPAMIRAHSGCPSGSILATKMSPAPSQVPMSSVVTRSPE